MASSRSCRLALWLQRHPCLHRHSWRTFSAAAATPAEESTAKKPKRRKKKTFFEVAQFLGHWGIGAKLTKTHWPSGNFYSITNVNLYRDGRHGAAWGVFHDQGKTTGKVEKIGGVNKRCWRYIEEPSNVWKRTEDIPSEV